MMIILIKYSITIVENSSTIHVETASGIWPTTTKRTRAWTDGEEEEENDDNEEDNVDAVGKAGDEEEQNYKNKFLQSRCFQQEPFIQIQLNACNAFDGRMHDDLHLGECADKQIAIQAVVDLDWYKWEKGSWEDC